ncbi:hypothetical protein [Hutsoniella sourekii]|uniref:hypothetical protein n=1 Tax=Hutsoniella sourekii TaxID=87650 RepID=UPI000487A83B|nr:hypothetical protein [Hutsoniella sourekii]
MELPIQSKQTVKSSLSRLFNPFIIHEDPVIPLIQPLKQVRDRLNQHYINQEPIIVLYEYYNRQQIICQKSVECYVKSPIQADQRVVLEDCHLGHHLLVYLDQIIKVSA